LIALSIAFIAIENIFKAKHKIASFKEKIIRLLIIFIFGLLHGMGFATMLKEFGLPDYAFYTALFSFNVGVEIAQLSVIIVCYLLLIMGFKNYLENKSVKGIKYNTILVIPFSLIIACIGLYWTYDRLDLETLL